MRKLIIAIIIIVALVVAASVFLVSPICKSYVNSHGEEMIGRKMDVKGFSLNLFNGNASLDDVTIYEHNSDSVFATIGDIDVDMNLIDLIKGTIIVNSLDIENAKVNIVQKDTTFNFDDMVAFFGEGESSEYTIGKLRVKKVDVHYCDISDDAYPLIYDIRDIEAKSDNYTASGKNHVEMKAKLGESGKADVKYDGSLADHSNMNVDLKLTQIDLKPFSPMFIRTFGREVLDGKLSLDTKLVVKNGAVDGQNHLLLENPKVEKVEDLNFKPEYRKIPLKACLYMITDKEGRCEMDLPVTGDMDNPKFSYKRAVMKCLGKCLTKKILPF